MRIGNGVDGSGWVGPEASLPVHPQSAAVMVKRYAQGWGFLAAMKESPVPCGVDWPPGLIVGRSQAKKKAPKGLGQYLRHSMRL